MPVPYQKPPYGAGQIMEPARNVARQNVGQPQEMPFLPKAPNTNQGQELRPGPQSPGGEASPAPIGTLPPAIQETLARASILSALAVKYPSRELFALAELAQNEAREITGVSNGPESPKRGTESLPESKDRT